MHYKHKIEKLEESLQEEREISKKLKPELDNKISDTMLFKTELEKLKDFYDNKVEILNNKILTDKERLQELKTDVKSRNEVIYHFKGKKAIKRDE